MTQCPLSAHKQNMGKCWPSQSKNVIFRNASEMVHYCLFTDSQRQQPG